VTDRDDLSPVVTPSTPTTTRSSIGCSTATCPPRTSRGAGRAQRARPRGRRASHGVRAGRRGAVVAGMTAAIPFLVTAEPTGSLVLQRLIRRRSPPWSSWSPSDSAPPRQRSARPDSGSARTESCEHRCGCNDSGLVGRDRAKTDATTTSTTSPAPRPPLRQRPPRPPSRRRRRLPLRRRRRTPQRWPSAPRGRPASAAAALTAVRPAEGARRHALRRRLLRPVLGDSATRDRDKDKADRDKADRDDQHTARSRSRTGTDETAAATRATAGTTRVARRGWGRRLTARVAAPILAVSAPRTAQSR
jgi:hypothetical protein